MNVRVAYRSIQFRNKFDRCVPESREAANQDIEVAGSPGEMREGSESGRLVVLVFVLFAQFPDRVPGPGRGEECYPPVDRNRRAIEGRSICPHGSIYGGTV